MDASVTDTAAHPTQSAASALIRLLYVARALRGFGDGFAVIILPAYMTALGYDAIAVGIVATASLSGTALLTLITGWIAPRHDLRPLLISGACLMAATGIAFPAVEQFVLIVLVSFIGTINASGGDLGMLVPLEHSVLAHSASDERRTQVFARYSLIGALCTAAGSLAASLPDFLVAGGSTQLTAFRLMFYAYAALGIACAMLYRYVPHARGEARAPQAPLGPRAGRSTRSRRCSASIPLPAALSRNRCWCCGCSSGSTSHSPPPDCSSSGRARSPRSPIQLRPGSPSASAS
jgi:MFS family permease